MDSFRSWLRKKTSSLLALPPAVRPKKLCGGPVRRSSRIAQRNRAGSPIKRQQRVLISQLGIAHEGATLGDDALQSYLEIFDQPLSQEHISAILALFGWDAGVLPLMDDAPSGEVAV